MPRDNELIMRIGKEADRTGERFVKIDGRMYDSQMSEQTLQAQEENEKKEERARKRREKLRKSKEERLSKEDDIATSDNREGQPERKFVSFRDIQNRR